MMYALPENVFDPRPGDTIIADLDGLGWQVMIIDHLVAVAPLLPFGERGHRSYVDEGAVRDSEPARWEGQVQVLVRLHPNRFDTPESAAAAVDTGQLDPAVPDVLIMAGRLEKPTTILHSPGARPGADDPTG